MCKHKITSRNQLREFILKGSSDKTGKKVTEDWILLMECWKKHRGKQETSWNCSTAPRGGRGSRGSGSAKQMEIFKRLRKQISQLFVSVGKIRLNQKQPYMTINVKGNQVTVECKSGHDAVISVLNTATGKAAVTIMKGNQTLVINVMMMVTKVCAFTPGTKPLTYPPGESEPMFDPLDKDWKYWQRRPRIPKPGRLCLYEKRIVLANDICQRAALSLSVHG